MTNKVNFKSAMKELAYKITMVNLFGSKQITNSHGLLIHFDNGAERKLNDGLYSVTVGRVNKDRYVYVAGEETANIYNVHILKDIVGYQDDKEDDECYNEVTLHFD